MTNLFPETQNKVSKPQQNEAPQLQLPLSWTAVYPLRDSNWRTDTTHVVVTVPPGYAPDEALIYKVEMGYKQPSPDISGPLYSYAPNTDIIHCPGDRRFNRPIGGGFAWDSYSGVNGLNGESAPFLTKKTQLRHPSERFLWVEGSDGRGENVGSWNMANTGTPARGFSDAKFRDSPADFHGGTAGFSFADAHSEQHKWLDATTLIYARSENANKDSGSPEQTAAQANSKQDQQWLGRHYPTVKNP